MKLQSTPWTCGPTALVNALDTLGHRLTEEAAAKLARTSPRGTDDADMLRALKTLGYKTHEIRSKDETLAWGALFSQLSLGRPVLLAVEHDTHWVAAVGLIGARVLAVDSADGAVVRAREYRDLVEWWAGPGKSPNYYGIAVIDP